MLRIENLVAGYGDILGVRGVSLDVPAGQIVAVLGANGAGKSTLLKAVMGIIRSRSGTIRFDGQEVRRTRPHRLVRRGMTLVPEGRGTIAPLTVEENLLLAAGVGMSSRPRRHAVEEAYALFPRLHGRRTVKAGLLSGGEQQMLAFGRALATGPRLLLMDEPSTGLSPAITSVVMDAVSAMRDRGISVLVVEQNVGAALAIADYAYVLDRGVVAKHGNPGEMADDPAVREAFLGV